MNRGKKAQKGGEMHEKKERPEQGLVFDGKGGNRKTGHEKIRTKPEFIYEGRERRRVGV